MTIQLRHLLRIKHICIYVMSVCYLLLLLYVMSVGYLLLLLLLFTVGILLYLQDVCAYLNNNGEVKSVCFKSNTLSPKTYFSGRHDPITISFSGGGGRGTVPGDSQIYLFSAQGNDVLFFLVLCEIYTELYTKYLRTRYAKCQLLLLLLQQ